MNSYREGPNLQIRGRPANKSMVKLQQHTKKGSNNKEQKKEPISRAEQNRKNKMNSYLDGRIPRIRILRAFLRTFLRESWKNHLAFQV